MQDNKQNKQENIQQNIQQKKYNYEEYVNSPVEDEEILDFKFGPNSLEKNIALFIRYLTSEGALQARDFLGGSISNVFKQYGIKEEIINKFLEKKGSYIKSYTFKDISMEEYKKFIKETKEKMQKVIDDKIEELDEKYKDSPEYVYFNTIQNYTQKQIEEEIDNLTKSDNLKSVELPYNNTITYVDPKDIYKVISILKVQSEKFTLNDNQQKKLEDLLSPLDITAFHFKFDKKIKYASEACDLVEHAKKVAEDRIKANAETIEKDKIEKAEQKRRDNVINNIINSAENFYSEFYNDFIGLVKKFNEHNGNLSTLLDEYLDGKLSGFNKSIIQDITAANPIYKTRTLVTVNDVQHNELVNDGSKGAAGKLVVLAKIAALQEKGIFEENSFRTINKASKYTSSILHRTLDRKFKECGLSPQQIQNLYSLEGDGLNPEKFEEAVTSVHDKLKSKEEYFADLNRQFKSRKDGLESKNTIQIETESNNVKNDKNKSKEEKLLDCAMLIELAQRKIKGRWLITNFWKKDYQAANRVIKENKKMIEKSLTKTEYQDYSKAKNKTEMLNKICFDKFAEQKYKDISKIDDNEFNMIELEIFHPKNETNDVDITKIVKDDIDKEKFIVKEEKLNNSNVRTNELEMGGNSKK